MDKITKEVGEKKLRLYFFRDILGKYIFYKHPQALNLLLRLEDDEIEALYLGLLSGDLGKCFISIVNKYQELNGVTFSSNNRKGDA